MRRAAWRLGRAVRAMSGAPAPPAEGACCGSGCYPCVWDTYYEAVETAGGADADAPVLRTVGDASDPFEKPQNCVRIVPVDDDDESDGEAPPPPPPHAPYSLSRGVVHQTADFGGVRSVVIETAGAASHPPAHHTVFVPNGAARVAALMSRLGWSERRVKVQPNVFSAGVNAPTYPYWIPQGVPLAVSEVLRFYTDVSSRASVRQQVLWVLAEFAKDAGERARLEQLASREGVGQYRAVFRAPQVHYDLARLLEEFPSSAPPLGRLLAALPQLKGRLFSNAGPPPGTGADRFELLVSKTPDGLGHASSHLRSLTAGDSVSLGGPAPPAPPPPVLFDRDVAAAPLLIVSNGSGAAAHLGYLRRAGGRGTTWWYHGCRHPADVPHPDELLRLVAALHIAVSTRPQPGAYPDTLPQGADRYVWGLLWRDREQVAAFVNTGAAVCLCGTPNMVRDTQTVLETVLGEAMWAAMRAEGRILTEKWGVA
eukprot:TRINITY_DN19544_c2_g1_i1.p1 TRINITY_DN19544_c2_g1~~TRINITY_DN19544_c2_g1_i1.p1  ORF type:complete len:482 (+),score=107.34 TRINITY_DN19544_c2_g1_i1:60-1505(+)